MNPKQLRTVALLTLVSLAILLVSGCSKPAAEPKLISREVLFGNPVKTNPQLSPDGKRMAYLAPVNNVLNVWVKTIGADDDRSVTKDDNRGIRNYFWAEDKRHIMYLQDVGGNENWRLYAVDLSSNNIQDLTPYENVQVQIVNSDKHVPNQLLIAMNKENPQVHDVYRLNVTTGKMDLAAKNPGNVTIWVSDNVLKIRGAMAATPDGGFDLMVRDDEKAPWKKLLTWDSENNLTSGAIGFAKDGKSIYLQDSRDVNAGRLVKLDIASGKTEVIAEDPQYDVADVVIHPDTYEVQAVGFIKARKEWKVLDASVQNDFAAIAKLNHGDFAITSRSSADDTWLVSFTADNGRFPFTRTTGRRKKGRSSFITDPI